MPYDDYVRTHVLAPAGATEMALGRTRLADRADEEVRYIGYPGEGSTTSVFPKDTQPVPLEYGGFYLEAMAAHGRWIASPVDLERFAVTIDGQSTVADQLTQASTTAMFADPHVPICQPGGGTYPENPSYWYGFGLDVNIYGNYWHIGSLPGTTTEDVFAAQGFTWSIFTNTRPAVSAQLELAMDQHRWDPILAATDWGSRDLFDQYPPWTDWTAQPDFRKALEQAQASGSYPTRLEARAGPSGAELRARFAPLPAGAKADVGMVLNCLDFGTRASRATAMGQALVSVQSYVDAGGVRRFQAVWATPY
jgi:CubicO group peptidase (beta-lactamase class C family)